MLRVLFALAGLLLVGCGTAPPPEVAPDAPLFRFGLLADVQYADKDDSGKRHYRGSLMLLEHCADDLGERDLAFVVQLGDVIDGNTTVNGSRQDLQQVLARFDRLDAPVHHVVGNHCFSLPRGELLQRLDLDAAYYSFVLDGWRFVVVDTLDLSVCGRQEGEKQLAAAESWLATAGEDRVRFPSAFDWNGGIWFAQFEWLRRQLIDAERAGEHVVVMGHLPVLERAAHGTHLLWNADAVLALFDEFDCVVAYLSGHYHPGGYGARRGIHHLTVPGMVEADPGTNVYAVVEVWPDELRLRGIGMADRVLGRR